MKTNLISSISIATFILSGCASDPESQAAMEVFGSLLGAVAEYKTARVASRSNSTYTPTYSTATTTSASSIYTPKYETPKTSSEYTPNISSSSSFSNSTSNSSTYTASSSGATGSTSTQSRSSQTSNASSVPPASHCIQVIRQPKKWAELRNNCSYEITAFWCYANGGDCKHGTWGTTSMRNIKAGGTGSATTFSSDSNRYGVYYTACKGHNTLAVEINPTSFYYKP